MVIFAKIHKRDKRETKSNENGDGFRMSPCGNVLLTMKDAVLFKTVILELMQFMCPVDGQLITRARKNHSIFSQKILTFEFLTTPIPLSYTLIAWPTSFPTLLQHLTFHADWSYQTKVSVGGRGCSKVGNVTLKNFFQFP